MIRDFEPSDAVTLARIHFASENAALDEWEAGVHMDGVPEDAAQGFLQSDATIRVAQIRREIVGWSMTSVDGEHGLVLGIYVTPERWRGGMGRELMLDAERLMVAKGATYASLWVMERHDRGRRFYEAMGWEAHPDETMTVTLEGVDLQQIEYVKRLNVAYLS